MVTTAPQVPATAVKAPASQVLRHVTQVPASVAVTTIKEGQGTPQNVLMKILTNQTLQNKTANSTHGATAATVANPAAIEMTPAGTIASISQATAVPGLAPTGSTAAPSVVQCQQIQQTGKN